MCKIVSPVREVRALSQRDVGEGRFWVEGDAYKQWDHSQSEVWAGMRSEHTVQPAAQTIQLVFVISVGYHSIWSLWGGEKLSSVTQMKFWKCLTPLSWQNQFHICGLNSCQWSALGGPQSNNHLLFAQSSQPWLQSLVWKSFQAPLWKSERRRSSVSVKAICDGQIFRVWKGESEKGVLNYSNLPV